MPVTPNNSITPMHNCKNWNFDILQINKCSRAINVCEFCDFNNFANINSTQKFVALAQVQVEFLKSDHHWLLALL